MGSYVNAVEMTHDRDEIFELKDRAPYTGHVFPRSSKQVDRPVIVGKGAQVNGSIYGRVVEILDGFSSRIEDTTRTLSIFGRESVFIGDLCRIGGHVTCAGEISIGDYSIVKGDVIAHKVKKIGQGTRIQGNLISNETLNIAENVDIGGYVIVLNGELAIEKNSKAFDIISSDRIKIGEDVTLSDPVILSRKGPIEFSTITVGRTYLVESKMSDVIMSGEINPYLIANYTFDYQKLIEELRKNLQNK